MRRGARGWAATSTRTLRDFITAAFLLICSTTSEGRSRPFNSASARSAVRAAVSGFADAVPVAGSGAVDGTEGSMDDSIEFCAFQFIPCRYGRKKTTLHRRGGVAAPHAAALPLRVPPPADLPLPADLAREVHCKKPAAPAMHDERRLR